MNTRLMERWIESGSEIARLSAEGTTTYWTDAVARGAAPWDVFDDVRRWWTEASRRERPQLVLAQRDRARVPGRPPARLLAGLDGRRGADAGPAAAGRPRLLHRRLLPHAEPDEGHHAPPGWSARSRSSGSAPPPRPAAPGSRTTWSFIERSIEHIGGPVNLIGDCQGGWLAAIYAALHPEHVNTLTLAGAPIDFHAGDAVIHDWVGALGGDDLAFYRWVVEQGGGVLKGEHMLNGFILIRPENEVAKQVQLLTHLHDAEHLERHHHFETWFKHVQDIPGTFYLWIVEHLFVANRPRRGHAGDRRRARRPRADRLPAVPARRRARPHHAARRRSSPRPTTSPPRPADIEKHVNSGGHLGLFMGSEALREHWPPILASVYKRSRRNADTAAAKARARDQTPRKRPAIPAP